MADLFFSVWPHDFLVRMVREKLLGLSLCWYGTRVSSPVVVAGVAWFRPLFGEALIAPQPHRPMDEILHQTEPRGNRTPDLAVLSLAPLFRELRWLPQILVGS